MLEKLNAPKLSTALWIAAIAYVTINISRGEINVPFYGTVYKFGAGA